jgi:hypothetical protein
MASLKTFLALVAAALRVQPGQRIYILVGLLDLADELLDRFYADGLWRRAVDDPGWNVLVAAAEGRGPAAQTRALVGRLAESLQQMRPDRVGRPLHLAVIGALAAAWWEDMAIWWRGADARAKDVPLRAHPWRQRGSFDVGPAGGERSARGTMATRFRAASSTIDLEQFGGKGRTRAARPRAASRRPGRKAAKKAAKAPARKASKAPVKARKADSEAGKTTRPQRVSIGFAHSRTPAEPLAAGRTLVTGRRYLLWVEIGPERARGSLRGAAPLPEVPAQSELDVVIFGFPGQLGIDLERRRGTLRIAADGSAEVTRLAAMPRGTGELGRHRLFFPVQTPRRPGRYRVRCNVYHRQFLLQSHLVTVTVTRAIEERARALRRTTDYTLSRSLDVARLAEHAPHRLSILHNDDGAGTHGFRFVGENDFVADASIDGATLGALVEYARGALRRVAWGTTNPWRSPELDPYRYAAPLPSAQLADDLLLLARHGYRLWSEALALFGVRGYDRATLRALMRTPGVVQLAIKQNANHVFPAALLYDHPLDTGRDRLTLCQAAAVVLKRNAELETSACFAGKCPNYGDDTVVCPSGFWGFRHELGVPLHMGKRGEVAAEIVRDGSTRALIGVSTDPAFGARLAHVTRLRTLLDATVLEERNACIRAFRGLPPHLAYFFCHGGITASGTPYLEIGAPKSEPITADSFTEIWWEKPRPLIVLNGCHTTAASPEQVFSMSTGFVVQANAAGVVGTEITIFEPMAVSFGEELLRQFLAGETIGRAVRRARLALLRQGNPLGLAYIPFALSTLRLTDAA